MESLVSMAFGPKDEEGYFALMNDLTYGRPDRLEGMVPGQMCQCTLALFRAGVRSWFYDRSSSVLVRGSSSRARVTLHEEFPATELRRADSERAERTDPRRAENSDHTRHFDIGLWDTEQNLRFPAKTPSTTQVKMASFHDAREFRGNQGEEEDVDVISVEPIAMIVPPELQDSPRIAAPENDARLSVSGGSEDHQPSTSSDSSTEETASEAEGVEEVGCSAPATSAATEVVVFEGWESKVLSGRLSNLCKAPKTLPAGFRFRAALHHEVADGAATMKGYIKLEEMVRRYQIPRTILIRAGTSNKRACSVSRTGWVPVYVDHFDAGLRFPLPGLIFDVLAEYELALSQLTPNSIKFIIGFMLLCKRLGIPAKAVVFRSLFLCCLCLSTNGTRWYYISGREKMMIFTNIRNKVARWKRQFVFVRDMRTDRINNKLAARLSEWRTPNTYMNYPQLTSGDVDLKNRLLDYVKARGLVDLEALVTPDQIALLRFVDVANLHGEGEMSSILERQRQRAQGSRGRGQQRQTRFDERPLAAPGHGSQHRSTSSAQRPRAEHRVEPVPSSSRRRVREDSDADVEDNVPLIRRRTSTGTQPASADAARLASVHQAPAREAAEAAPTSSSVVGPRPAACKGARSAAWRTCYADKADGCVQLYCRTLRVRLKEELQRAQAEKESGIQAAKEETGRAEDWAKRAEAERERTLHELGTLRDRVSQADQHVVWGEASLESTKRLHQRDVYFSRAQGAEWLVGAEMFQDAVAVASANTTTDIFNEGEEIDSEGKSLASPADTRVRLKWELNEEGLPVWPPAIVEEGEDTEGLPSFDAWVAGPQDVSTETSSTPPAQPQPPPAAATVSASSPPDRPSPARSTSEPNNASVPVDLTDD
ncbi:hypothetical protein SLEP1_g4937 [Rubroshorea leprosula]|uniref:Transposase (putative) gypsy type domain-containing protein n=1 Tax=Rubroshorea leprosula TaxID=152421 RepID=A0AAV5HY59_9ROSI|nr:hypothetical protein SLEP1_g4937 [Rubroshorea leprosula]